jgi:glyoxylase-like metal-dependent hydrolase (beta-lactamase superfamily II)
MTAPARKREVGRGEKLLPGVWRLRLPLPWPGVPHCNAWALAAGDGVVLVDTGMHEPGSLGHLERALDQVGLRLEHVRLLVCTHAHSDHCGQAAPILARAGCELWMHPDHAHAHADRGDPERALARRLEVARQSGVPEGPLRDWARARREHGDGVAEWVDPHRALRPGVEFASDLGVWQVVETPGHAPSHVCLFQAERRILISGDHVLGRVSLYYDYGWTPDPAGEFLRSLDAVQSLGARLCVAGHARPFTDVDGHVRAARALVHRRLDAAAAALDGGPRTAFEVQPAVHGAPVSAATGAWWVSETLVYLTHLERTGRVAREVVGEGDADRWRAAG